MGVGRAMMRKIVMDFGITKFQFQPYRITLIWRRNTAVVVTSEGLDRDTRHNSPRKARGTHANPPAATVVPKHTA